MNARTLKALRGSIRKWERIIEGEDADRGPLNCPLCVMFAVGGSQNCKGCPVNKHTRVQWCHRTPYEKWMAEWRAEVMERTGELPDDVFDPRMVIGPRTMAAAIAERDFLVSLLPPGE